MSLALKCVAVVGFAALLVGSPLPAAQLRVQQTGGLERSTQRPRQDWREAVELVPIPLPDLASLEPAVALRLGQVRALADQVIEESPDLEAVVAALGSLAGSYHAYDLRDPALASYDNLLRLNPSDFASRYLLGRLLEAEGRLEEAAQELERAQEIEPSYVPNLLAQGRILHALQFEAHAEGFYRHALSLEPRSAAALAGLGEIALASRRATEAVAYYRQALEFVPAATRLHYPLALAYRALGDTESARRHLALRGEAGVAANDPLFDALHDQRSGERISIIQGRLAFQTGRFEEAAGAFRTALEADPESNAARVDLAAALSALDRESEAVALLREVLDRDPDNSAALYNLGTVLAAGGDNNAAIAHFRRVTNLAPQDSGARMALVKSLRQAGLTEEALVEASEAAQRQPLDPDARLQEAAVLVDLQRYQEALERLEEATDNLPTNGALAHALAKLLGGSPELALRDGNRALELAQRVYKTRPSTEHALTLSQALAELGRCSEAAEWQSRAIAALESGGVDAELARQRLSALRAGAPCR